MVRPVSNIYIKVNGQSICVGKLVCECDDGPWHLQPNEYITNEEYEIRKKRFEVGDKILDDLVYHSVGCFVNNVAIGPVKQKWIDELSRQGYAVHLLQYEVEPEESERR